MKALKRFTQSITMILVVLSFFVVGILLVQIPNSLGIWQRIDVLWTTDPVVFWVFFVVTRLCLGASWGYSVYKIVTEGERLEFFWFKPDHSSSYGSSSGESRDMSGLILFVVLAVVFCILAAEAAIRIVTGTETPF